MRAVIDSLATVTPFWIELTLPLRNMFLVARNFSPPIFCTAAARTASARSSELGPCAFTDAKHTAVRKKEQIVFGNSVTIVFVKEKGPCGPFRFS